MTGRIFQFRLVGGGMRIHHVNIRTKNLDASIAFYRDVLGLVHGPRPDFGFPGAWLYDQDKVAIPLNEAVETPSTASNAFDHVAFYTEDLNSALARLDVMGVHYYELRPIPDSSLRQCFLKDLNGITIE
jgi:catechol 2,3-dioxygenase-like lactoylglutathione lyase family enzyme